LSAHLYTFIVTATTLVVEQARREFDQPIREGRLTLAVFATLGPAVL
jgi:hypothetical protein